MAHAPARHRLAAILSADAAGYSRLMAQDENSTIASLQAAREVFRQAIERQNGRVVDTAGDSILAIFETAIGAVTAALAVQVALESSTRTTLREKSMLFRIGVHLADIREQPDGSVYGDGVNVAARLQALAEPGGIALSDIARSAIKGKLPVGAEDAGEHRVKNLPEPLRVFKVAPGNTAIRSETSPKADEALSRDAPSRLTLPDKPSIAVLSFTNMSADPEQEYFCDGVSEDIITELSRFRSLMVIARNSSFTFKGRAVDVRAISRELGVRYVLEGSVRRAANRLRLTAQLIDAVTGAHLWAEKYDRDITQIFDIQEELTERIVVSIAPFIEAAERERVRRQPRDLGAYEIGVRAMAKADQAYRSNDRRLLEEAMSDASAALRLDATSVLALGALGSCQWQRLQFEAGIDAARAWQDGIDIANKAIESDRNDCMGYVVKAMLLALAPGSSRAEDALLNARRAYELNPHDMRVLLILAWVEALGGLTTSALDHLDQVMRISPRDPWRYATYNQFAMTCFMAGQYAEGARFAALGVEEAPMHGTLHAWLALNRAALGDSEGAREAMVQVRKLAPSWLERKLAEGFLFRDEDHRARAASFLRIAADLEPSRALQSGRS